MRERKKYYPFILSAFLLIVDQISKILVVRNIPENTIAKSFLNDFLWIVHVRNTGAGFSFLADSGTFVRIVVLILLPVVLLGMIAYEILSNKNSFSYLQRFFLAGILGGGAGTLCDRIFRFKTGVVDFISVKFYGFLGFDRWPTFNISDSCVVVFVVLLIISMIIDCFKKKKAE